MELTDAQKDTIKKWVAEGATLAELQQKIKDEFKLSLTFMDVRFLVLDLGVKIKEQEKSGGSAVTIDKTAAPDDVASDDSATEAVGGVSVTLDRVVKPGAVISGRVTFSDGVGADWMLDQFGRLGLSASRPGYRPSQEDLQAFQEELSHLLQNHGM